MINVEGGRSVLLDQRKEQSIVCHGTFREAVDETLCVQLEGQKGLLLGVSCAINVSKIS